jgi:putative two-component system response regulator
MIAIVDEPAFVPIAGATVLIADDRAEDRRLLRLVLEHMGHKVVEASNGVQALELARRVRPDMVLSDILMPEMDGFELCRKLQEDDGLRHVPLVFVTATYSEPRYQEFASEVGAAKVLLKPFNASDLRKVIKQSLTRGAPTDVTQRFKRLDQQQFLERHAEEISNKLQDKVRELEAANERLQASERRSRALTAAVVQTITKMVEYRDPYTTGHERRVGDLAAAIGAKLGYRDEELDGLRMGGYLHDVGKVAIPAEILTKPGRLTENEFRLIQGHTEIGYDILAGIDFPWPVAELARQHHERLDGKGYPRGLVGDQILPAARVIAVADVVESMASHRPYRPSLGPAKAIEEIQQGRGTRYDPAVVDACVRLFEEDGYTFT